MKPTIEEIESHLRQTGPREMKDLWNRADAVRKENVGDAVHLRGLLEISNTCVRACAYCGLSRENTRLQRYRMTAEEIFDCLSRIVSFGYGTVVMQAGEDYGIEADWLAGIIRQIRQTTPLAVTLSMGERPFEELKRWRQAGADRYLLRFETSDPDLYRRIHPARQGQTADRRKILNQLRDLGYEVGSGVMIGLPGQTFRSLARDIELFGRMDLDMVGVGPYIPNPDTPLGSGRLRPKIDPAEQVPNTEQMAYQVIALTRLVCPEANIPSTTALATINRDSGRERGLSRGANVVMPNVTPLRYRQLYEIYPGKACLNETAEVCRGCLAERIAALGRHIGTGPGSRIRRAATP